MIPFCCEMKYHLKLLLLCSFVALYSSISKAENSNEVKSLNRSEYKRVILEKQIPISKQLNKEDVVYVIQNDFLVTSVLEIPKNCILDFDGGCLFGNGTVKGYNTQIRADKVTLFDSHITISGTWDVAEVYPIWFGAKGDGITNDTKAIQKSLFFNVEGDGKTYAVDRLNILSGGIKNAKFKFVGEGGCVISVENRSGVRIENVVVDGYNKAECCLSIKKSCDINITHSEFYGVNCPGPDYIHGIYIYSSDDINISKSKIHDIYTSAVSSENGGASRAIASVNSINVTIEKCELYNIGGSVVGGCGDAIQFIAQTRYGYKETKSNNAIIGCTFYDNNYRHVKIQQYGCRVKDNIMKVGKIEPTQSCISIYDCYCICEGNMISTEISIPILIGAINNDLNVFKDIIITKNIIDTKLRENSAIFFSNCELIEKVSVTENICTCSNNCNFINIRTNVNNFLCANNNIEGCTALINMKKGFIKHDSTFMRDNVMILGNVIKDLKSFIVYIDEDDWCHNIVVANNIGVASNPSKHSTFKNSLAGPNNLRKIKSSARISGNVINTDYTDGAR